jgi:hypothetical protein
MCGDDMDVIGNVVIGDGVKDSKFCCDVPLCRGACCTLAGGRGAPLEDQEIDEIAKAFPAAKKFLSKRSLEAIERGGLTDGVPGDFATPCIDNHECVFVSFDGDVARCSFEMAHAEGLTSWPKPISCHLFPLRARTFGQTFLRYEEIEECSAGRERGGRDNVKLGTFLEAPLTRKLGKAWFDQFRRAIDDELTE